MKKVFPFIVLIVVTILFITSEVVIKTQSSNAGQLVRSKEKFTLYEKLFQELTVKTNTGKRVKLSAIKAPVVILNFWASWCIPCIKEFPSLVELKSKFKDSELVVLGFNNDEGAQEKIIKKFEKKYKLNFASVADKASYITTDKFLISDIPVSIIYENGKIYEVSKGDRDFNDIDLSKLIKKANSSL
jgi:thiol-disulfide isomerase/thioredoxin